MKKLTTKNNRMLNESALYTTPEGKYSLPQQEMIESIKREATLLKERYLANIDKENVGYTLNEIQTLRNMSENYTDHKLPEYIDQITADIIKANEDHTERTGTDLEQKNIQVAKDRIKTMPELSKFRDPKKRTIGTHN